MNPLLKKLEKISSKKKRRIIGLMSGTSMDGLDIALCRFSGSGTRTSFELEEFTTVSYPDDVNRQLIGFAAAECLDPQLLCVWHTWLAHLHARHVNEALEAWKVDAEDVDLIASHGQTLYHAPKHKHNMKGMPNATFQIGDGDHIAHLTGIITISDFRQRDTARGNEGAPLAAYGDYLLFSDPGTHRILLNVGGISNFTWLPTGSGPFPPLSFDTGPGNTLIDAAARQYFTGLRFDAGGGLAGTGTVHAGLLGLLRQHPYFKIPPPKTTGFEVFHLNWVENCLDELGLLMVDKRLHPDRMQAVDLLATLTRLTVGTIADQIRNILPQGEAAEVLVSGGGAYNDTLVNGLREVLQPVPVSRIDDLGVPADAKEALFFAALANELVCGEDTRLHLGKISLPDAKIDG